MGKRWTETDIADMVKKGNVEAEWQTPTGRPEHDRFDRKWAQTEYDFANEYLEPRLERGASLGWWDQPKFRLPWGTYTPDFAELYTDGTLYIYEIKGDYRLGSAGRSNTALRAFRHLVKSPDIIILRATRQEGGRWKFETIEDKRERGPHTRAKVEDE